VNNLGDNKPHHFTTPWKIINAAKTVFTVLVLKDGTYAITITKINRDKDPKVWFNDTVLFEHITMPLTRHIIHSEKALAGEMSNLLFDEDY
jgi:hypothetical protein